MQKHTLKLKKWELALAAALLASLLLGATLRESRELESKLLRLHVVANSDSAADQSLKLRVRDAVLAELGGVLDGCADKEEAAARITAALPRVEAAAERCAGQPVTTAIADENFPTVEYEGFALPAGRYTALRVVIGEGEGHNWWCVVFPPLCAAAAGEAPSMEELGLSRESVALISGDTAGCRVKFRLLEWAAQLKKWIFN